MQIYDHDTPEAINFKNSSIELENWLEHLYYIEKEISNLIKLVSDSSERPELSEQLRALEQSRERNTSHISKLIKYRDTLPKAAECEDMQCDMFYINEHIKYRKLYREHLESYRKTKEAFFKILTP